MGFGCVPSLAASSRHLELGHSPASILRVLSYRHVHPCQDSWHYMIFFNLIFSYKSHIFQAGSNLVKGRPWLLYPLASTSQVLGRQLYSYCDLCGVGNWTQGPCESNRVHAQHQNFTLNLWLINSVTEWTWFCCLEELCFANALFTKEYLQSSRLQSSSSQPVGMTSWVAHIRYLHYNLEQ